MIPGASRPDRVDENLRPASTPIPVDQWDALKAVRLIEEHALAPTGPV
ncbi:hypothetical protein [Burkholderia anthina]|uniref:Aldo/keto reductase n=1 Tax=Burkholderia anthina TaxID=179879 RepID=A0A6P2GEZ4_9BURK|nr:hypothetical protein [Burkholderia anthina]MBM2771316.1 hypothetical protein [Burkholderia anthina]VVU51599.1 aldo/keto reductase [Burkholderia anthina]